MYSPDDYDTFRIEAASRPLPGGATNKRVADELLTTVQRRWPRSDNPASTHIRLKIGERIPAPTPLEVFLSARWGLYTTTRRGRLRYAPISHAPWQLQRAEIVSLDDSLITAAGFAAPTIAKNGEPHVMFSSGLPVRIGLPRRVS